MKTIKTIRILILLSHLSYSMEIDFVGPAAFQSRDIIESITNHLTIDETGALLRTCTTVNNHYGKGLPLKIVNNHDNVSADDILSIQFGINRYIQEHPEKISSFSAKIYTRGLIHYAQTNNSVLFPLLISSKNNTHAQQRDNICNTFSYDPDTLNTANIRKFTKIIISQNHNHTLLHWAKTNNLTYLKILLKFNANAYINAQDDNGHTPLHHATSNNNLKMVRTLLMHGANPNIHAYTNKNLVTPLIIAIYQNNTDIALLLLQKEANINALHKFNQTCLHEACILGNIDMVKILLSWNANIYLNSTRGTTAKNFAFIGNTKNRMAIYDLLLLWEKDHPPEYYS